MAVGIDVNGLGGLDVVIDAGNAGGLASGGWIANADDIALGSVTVVGPNVDVIGASLQRRAGVITKGDIALAQRGMGDWGQSKGRLGSVNIS